MKSIAWVLALASVLAPAVSAAQNDPFTLPTPRPASAGAYQWGIEMLRFDKAWAITRGRALLGFSDVTPIAAHEDLRSGFDGPLRPHLSGDLVLQANRYHAMMTVGVAAARGGNGVGISGACPMCAVAYFDGANDREASFGQAAGAGAVVVNLSAGGTGTDSCANGAIPAAQCRALERLEERDVAFVTIAGNNAEGSHITYPGNFPTAIPVGGLQSDGKFWTVSHDTVNRGSNWGPEIRLLAPSSDILVPQPPGGVYFLFPAENCGDRFDSVVGTGQVILPPSYSGYGDCSGTSFSAPWITALIGLMRSANPLLTAPQVRQILYDTAANRPVAGPAGSGLTFNMPDAEAALRAAIGGDGVTNRVTPMFSLFAASTGHHIFTTSPQAAVAAAAGEMLMHDLRNPQTFTSFGDPVPGYATFSGKICATKDNCITVPARQSFSVFTTENAPAGTTLAPLFRMSQVCTAGSPNCSTTRVFAYATSESGVRDLEQQGYPLDVVEGYVYSPSAPRPDGALALCHAYDQQRFDHILYAAPSCDHSQLTNSAGENTGGNYIGNQLLGFLPKSDATPIEANHTGLWWNPAESGWGVNFAHQGDVLFATLFSYDASHKPLWLVMSAGLRQFIPGPPGLSLYSGTLYRTTGAPFNTTPFPPIQPANITAVGTMSVTFATTATTLQYDVDGTRVVKTITPQVFGARAATCGAATGSRAGATNYQDLWWNPDEAGWGINFTHQGDVIFATLFTYGADGKGLWLVMSQGRKQADGSYAGDLYRTSGPAFDAQPFNPIGAADVVRVGSMRVQFTNGESGRLDYTVDGVAVGKAIVRQVFATGTPVCDSR